MIVTRRDLLAAAALFGVAPAAGATATQLRIVGDRVYISVVVDGSATEALLDSGAEASVLDTDFADRLGLARGAPATARGSGAATAMAELVPGVRLRVAGLELRPAAVAVIDLGDISRRLAHRRIDVIVGRELFDAARLAIDLRGGTLARARSNAEPAGERLPLTGRRGIETMPMFIEGRPVQAEFDLGNGGRVLIGASLARRLLRDGRATGSIGAGGIGGETRHRTLVLRDLTLAGRRFVDVPAAVDANPQAADANIGVRVLRNFRIVTDFTERAIWLEAR